MVVASMGSVAKRAPCFSHAFRAQACKDAAQGLGKPLAEQFPGFSMVLWVGGSCCQRTADIQPLGKQYRSCLLFSHCTEDIIPHPDTIFF